MYVFSLQSWPQSRQVIADVMGRGAGKLLCMARQNGFVLGENWCDESSLGRNIWPFLTRRGDPKGTPSTCWNQGSEVICLEAEIAK